MRILTREDIANALTMSAAIAAVGDAFAQLSSGQADVPIRAALRPAGHDGVALIMPGYLRGSDALAVKVASVFPGNRELKLPTVHALVLLLDAATGAPLAVMEGSSLTALRTGAASGVATERLARQDARVAAIFGAGVQARTQLLAVCAVRPLREAWIHAPRPRQVEAFIDELQPQLRGIELRAAQTPAQAVRAADIICTATTSATPVFAGTDVNPGAHINAVGSFTPQMQEVDETTLQRASRIVVDSREAALAEAGDLLIAFDRGAIQMSDISGEIGELLRGRISGRESADEITYFKSVGNAAQDVAVAQAIYQHAVQTGLGTELSL
ncbi:MAG: ornithine cyclodeaminase family protein [Blastocatellia bacterium]|nr:ornithine cyclodeaminase family protein [Blastocatellia bacterium]